MCSLWIYNIKGNEKSVARQNGIFLTGGHVGKVAKRIVPAFLKIDFFRGYGTVAFLSTIPLFIICFKRKKRKKKTDN